MADKKETVKTEAAPAAAPAEPAPAPVPAIPPLTLELDQETLEGLQLIADAKKTDVQTIVKKFCTRASKAALAAKAADEKKATDIMIQQVGVLVSVSEYFVIATAANSRQVDAIVEAVEDAVRIDGHRKPLHREYTKDGSWSLLDYGDFVVHVFQPEARDYYRLEALWNDAPIVDLKEAGITDAVYSDRIAELMEKMQKEA